MRVVWREKDELSHAAKMVAGYGPSHGFTFNHYWCFFWGIQLGPKPNYWLGMGAGAHPVSGGKYSFFNGALWNGQKK